jgi:hypothetical protein
LAIASRRSGIDIAAGVAIGRQVIDGVVVDRVDGIGVDELLDGHHRRAFDLHAVQIIIAQQQILVFPELVAFDQIAALELLSGLGILRDHADAVSRFGIDEVEADRGPVVAGVVEGHGAGNEGEPEVTAPDRTCGHQAALSG